MRRAGTPVRAIIEAIAGDLRAGLIQQAIDTLKKRGLLGRAEARRIADARKRSGV